MKKIILIGLVLMTVSIAFSQSKNEQIEILDHQLDSITTVIHQARQQYKDDKKKLEDNISEFNLMIANLKKQIETIDNTITESEKTVESLDNEIDKLKAEIKDLKSSKKESLNGTFKNASGNIIIISNHNSTSFHAKLLFKEKNGPCQGMDDMEESVTIDNDSFNKEEKTTNYHSDEYMLYFTIYQGDFNKIRCEPAVEFLGMDCGGMFDSEFTKQ
ncbi:MAG: hypothetical protein M9897_09250 [Brumimicrobium sp.]|nr:hypothetical protein [Brumimicrobium sp.]